MTQPEIQPEFRILTVCEGNLSRSPLAERLLARLLPTFAVESAGVRAVVGSAMEPLAAVELETRGVSAEHFTSRQLVAGMADGADLVLVATRDLRTRVLEEAPRGLRRTFTMLEFAALAPLAEGATPAEVVAWAAANRPSVADLVLDVPDPYGRSVALHQQVAETIDRATTAIAAALRR